MVLKSKITLVIASVILITIGLSSAFVLNVQQERMIAAKLKDVEAVSSIIQKIIETAMKKGEAGEIQNVVEDIGQNKELLKLRILSNDGYILKSGDIEEVGAMSRLFSRKKYDKDRFKPIIQGNSITHFKPVYNKRECYGCHNPDVKVNGIIEIDYDISRSRADILSIKKFLVLSNIATVFIVSALLSILISRLIVRPLSGFLSAIKEVEDGNWNAHVAEDEQDELGTIGKAFNKMTSEIRRFYEKDLKREKEIARAKTQVEHKRKLEELNSHLEYKVKEVETANKAVLSLSKEVKTKNLELEKMVDRLKKINEIGRVLTSIIETDELMRLIIKTAAEMLFVKKGSIHLAKQDDTNLSIKYQRGIGVENTTDMSLDLSPHYKELMDDGKNVFISKNNKKHVFEEDTTSTIGVPLKLKGQIIGGMLLEEKADGSHFTVDELELLGTMANQAMVAIENAWLYETVKDNYFGTIQSLVNALEANDKYTRGHSERVRHLSVELARFVGIDHKELEILEHAAILHDIGKIGIDSFVLNKAGKLSSDEFSLIKAHPLIGDEILGPIGTLEGVRQTILQHHERYDGTGYPYGVAGNEISLKARILTVVDTFDAMLTDRPYRKALPLSMAKEELITCSSTQFDPFVVNAFLEMVDTTDILSNVSYNLN